MGDRGYLVTFRATDPLYVVDLADPTDPRLAGELEVDGYSDYLHPIEENYLLGIGMDAIAVSDFGDGRDGGVVQGLKVSLYNVTDPSAPTEVDTMLLGQRGTYSSALYDHRAISVLPPGNGRVATRVAFGIDIAGLAQPARRPDPEDAWTYYNWRYNALHGIEVRTGADAGLTLTGSLEAASADDPAGFGFSYGSGTERAVMVGRLWWVIRLTTSTVEKCVQPIGSALTTRVSQGSCKTIRLCVCTAGWMALPRWYVSPCAIQSQSGFIGS